MRDPGLRDYGPIGDQEDKGGEEEPGEEEEVIEGEKEGWGTATL